MCKYVGNGEENVIFYIRVHNCKYHRRDVAVAHQPSCSKWQQRVAEKKTDTIYIKNELKWLASMPVCTNEEYGVSEKRRVNEREGVPSINFAHVVTWRVEIVILSSLVCNSTIFSTLSNADVDVVASIRVFCLSHCHHECFLSLYLSHTQRHTISRCEFVVKWYWTTGRCMRAWRRRRWSQQHNINICIYIVISGHNSETRGTKNEFFVRAFRSL